MFTIKVYHASHTLFRKDLIEFSSKGFQLNTNDNSKIHWQVTENGLSYCPIDCHVYSKLNEL